jgi:hypothetical protein
MLYVSIKSNLEGVVLCGYGIVEVCAGGAVVPGVEHHHTTEVYMYNHTTVHYKIINQHVTTSHTCTLPHNTLHINMN